MSILQWLQQGIKGLRGVILPVFARAQDVRTLGRTLLWVTHFGLLVLILVGLGFVNYALDLEKLLEAPLPVLRKIWLPFLFFIVYLLAWLGWWLWVLLGAEEERTSYPDIDRTWEHVVAELAAAGIPIAEVPIFLVVGQPAGSEQALFAGSQLELTLEDVPKDPNAPFHVYANEDAIFVTCAGASLLGKQARLFMEEETATPIRKEAARVSGSPDDLATGSQPSINLTPEQTAAMPAFKPSQSGSIHMTMESQLLTQEKAVSSRLPARLALLKDTEEVSKQLARLKHLCWLILRERRPYCPINGILLLLPYAATDSDTEANQTGLVCQKDLRAIRDVMQINCPLFGLVCDMENATGFREFVERFPKGHRQRRLGQQFPYVANLDAAAGGDLIDIGVRWICEELFPPLIYRLMRLDKPGGHEKVAPILRGNMNLYELLEEIRERRQRLARILSLAIAADTREPILFGGCYLAATGKSPREQAFVAAVFHRLLENQNFVSWTRSARAEEADYSRWIRYGYTALATFTLTLFAMGFAFMAKR